MAKSSRPKYQNRGKVTNPAVYIVFISYSTPDSWIAHVIKEKIEAVGATAYVYEKDLAGGGIIIFVELMSVMRQ